MANKNNCNRKFSEKMTGGLFRIECYKRWIESLVFNGNKIISVDQNGKERRIYFVKGLFICFKGRNSTVVLHKPFPKFIRCRISLGDNSKVVIGDSNERIKRLVIRGKPNGIFCSIGRNLSVMNGCRILFGYLSGIKVTVGDDCMFATNITLRTTDGHIVRDKNTNKILNVDKSIEIGNHCWLVNNVQIFKGVKIADNCIIGANSLVLKECPDSNCMYAGTPARKVRENIIWERRGIVEADLINQVELLK